MNRFEVDMALGYTVDMAESGGFATIAVLARELRARLAEYGGDVERPHEDSDKSLTDGVLAERAYVEAHPIADLLASIARAAEHDAARKVCSECEGYGYNRTAGGPCVCDRGVTR